MAQHHHHHKPEHTNTIAVVGASGAQGGSVVRSLLGKDGHHHRGGPYHVRALVRDPESAEAKRLAALGAEVVAFDWTNRQSIHHAFHGCHGVFAMTTGGNEETAIGRSLANVAHEEKVSHFVWSGLENTEKISEGKYRCAHFTHKAKVEDRLREIHGMAWTSVYPGFFYSNIKNFYTPVQGQHELEIRLPISGHVVVPYVDPATAVGPVVAEIFADKNKYNGKVVPIIGEEVNHNDICDHLSRAWHKHVKFVFQTPEDWVASHPNNPMASELADMFRFVEEFGYYHERDTKLSRKIDLHPATFQQWLQHAHWQM